MVIKLRESKRITESALTDYRKDYADLIKYGGEVDAQELYPRLKEDGFELVDATYKEDNHNRQSWQYIFYNEDTGVYCDFYRIGNTPHAPEKLSFMSKVPTDKLDKISKRQGSFDDVWKLNKNPDKFKTLLNYFGESRVESLREDLGDWKTYDEKSKSLYDYCYRLLKDKLDKGPEVYYGWIPAREAIQGSKFGMEPNGWIQGQVGGSTRDYVIDMSIYGYATNARPGYYGYEDYLTEPSLEILDFPSEYQDILDQIERKAKLLGFKVNYV